MCLIAQQKTSGDFRVKKKMSVSHFGCSNKIKRIPERKEKIIHSMIKIKKCKDYKIIQINRIACNCIISRNLILSQDLLESDT